MRFLTRSLALAAIGGLVVVPAIAPPAPVWAQAAGPLYTIVVPSAQFGSQAFARVVTSSLLAAQKFCSDLGDTAFRVDCLAERLSVVAAEIPDDSDYGEVSEVLKTASDQLADLARQNRDPARGRSHAVRKNTDQRTTRPLTPVAPQAAAAVNQQAIAILEETQTVLLRSAENSTEKRIQYAQIADAIDSNKVLLRA